MLNNKYSAVLVLVNYLNIVNAVNYVDSIKNISDSNNNHNLRLKRQDDDRWIWGMVSLAATPTPAPESPPIRSQPIMEENPCDQKPIEIPNLKRPGRRISEQKCYEHIWNIKFRESESQRNRACIYWKQTHRGPNDPYFAIGGRDADPGEFPHMGAIGWKAVLGTWIFKCGGSLISTKFVLTAAHCTKATDTDTSIADTVPKIVRFGDKNIIDKWDKNLPPMDSNIKNIILHPDYKSPRKYNDIALMEMEQEHDFTSNYQPACLWGDMETISLGDIATATGWGVIESDGRETSPDLQVVELDFIDSRTCAVLLQKYHNRLWDGIADTQICAGKLQGGVDDCRGDSGGPLQTKIILPPSSQGAMHYVVGVTSFGFGCALANTPGVYTRVAAYIDWIENIVWPGQN